MNSGNNSSSSKTESGDETTASTPATPGPPPLRSLLLRLAHSYIAKAVLWLLRKNKL